MKIFHLITGLNNGGAEGVLHRLASTDSLNEHFVVSMMDSGKYGELLEENNVSVRCLNMPRGKLEIRGLIKLGVMLRSFEPDVVQTWMYHADLVGGGIARLIGYKNIYWNIRGAELSSDYTRLSTRLIVKLLAFFSKFIPKGIISCSSVAISVHRQLGYVGNFTYIPNGIDTDRYFPDYEAGLAEREKFLFIKQAFLIGAVARYSPQKNHNLLLECVSDLIRLKKFPNVMCVLVGPGLNSENYILTDRIKELGIQSHVLLHGESANINGVMNAIDLHVLASSYGEGFPNVIAEAMACGTPCLATDVGDTLQVIGNDGWVVEPDNRAQFLEGLISAIRLHEDDEKWANLCKSVRKKIVDNYGLDQMVARYRAVWKNDLRG